MKLVKLTQDMLIGDVFRVKGQVLLVQDGFGDGVTLKQDVDKRNEAKLKRYKDNENDQGQNENDQGVEKPNGKAKQN